MQIRLRSLRRHPLVLVVGLTLLAVGLPYGAALLAPTAVSSLLWLDVATLAVGVLAAVVLLLRWRVTSVRHTVAHSMTAPSTTTPSTPTPSTTALATTAVSTAASSTAVVARYRAHGHRWLGRVLAVPLSWLLLTGSLTLYRAELDLWLTPALRQCCAGMANNSAALGVITDSTAAVSSVTASGEVRDRILTDISTTNSPTTDSPQAAPSNTASSQATPSPELALTAALSHASDRSQKLDPSQQSIAAQQPSSFQKPAVPLTAAQQVLLAQQVLAKQAPNAVTWYIEFSSARKPYLTLHWADADYQLHRQYVTLQGQPVGAASMLPFGVQSHTFGGLVFDLHYTLLGRAWLEPLKKTLQPWVRLPLTGLGVTSSMALLWLVLAISGVWLSWRWWRQGRVGGAQLRWHVYLGLVGAPWLVLYGVSALATQLGNWRDIPANISAAAYFSELFPEPQLPAIKEPVSDQTDHSQPDNSQQDHPQPDLPRQVATNQSPAATKGNAELLPSETTPSDELSAARVQQLVQRWPSAEPMPAISKLSWPRAEETAIWQLSGSALWPAQGTVMPMQARQRLQDGAIALASTTAPTPWQWRHALYQLHQSYYLNPWQRAVMFALGLLCWVGVVLALRRNQPNAATRYPVNGWLHAAATLPLVALLSTAGLLQVLELPALTLFAISSGLGVLWMSGRQLYLYCCKNNQ